MQRLARLEARQADDGQAVLHRLDEPRRQVRGPGPRRRDAAGEPARQLRLGRGHEARVRLVADADPVQARVRADRVHERHERAGDREIIDLMLAHVKGDVEAAYNRAAYMPRRRQLAQEWAKLLNVDLKDPRTLG